MAFDGATPGVAMIDALARNKRKHPLDQGVTQEPIPSNVRFMEMP